MEKNKLFASRLLINIALLMMIFVVSVILVTTVLQLLNISISSINTIIAIIITIASYLILKRKDTKKMNGLAIVLTTILVLLAGQLASNVYDTSADGNAYHKYAIGSIADGYNPFYDSHIEFSEEHYKEEYSKNNSLWIEHYPKATWNYAASMYHVTNNIETGKMITLIIIMAATFLTIAYLATTILKLWQSIIVGILVTFNPIVLSQIFTYYVDGIMMLTIYMAIIMLLMLSNKKTELLSNSQKWIMLTLVSTIAINLKFTGAFFIGVACIVFYLYWLFLEKGKKTLKKTFTSLTIKFALIVIVSVLVIGGSTYIRNTIDHQVPLYPLMGEDSADIVTTMQPQSFGELNGLTKLFLSIFSESANITYSSGLEPTLKVPFTYSQEEIDILFIPDLRIGGYGILFSGIFILSTIALVYALYYYKKNKVNISYPLVITAIIAIVTLPLSEAWWARYAPLLYLIPIMSIIALFHIANLKSKDKKTKRSFIAIYIASFILVTTIGLNLLPFVNYRIQDINNSILIEDQLEQVANENEESIEIVIEKGRASIFNLRDFGIEYKVVEESEDKIRYLYWYSIKY